MSVNLPSSTQQPLTVLESSGLIRLVATRPELEYLFRHVLIQDAAYDTLLKQERRRLHVAVAATLQALYPERLDELAAVLAWHYEQAGEAQLTLPWLVRAGQVAVRRFANPEAFSFFVRAAALAPAGDEPAMVRQRIEIALGTVRAGFRFRPPGELVATLEAVAPAAEETGDLDLIGQVQLWTATMQRQSGVPYEDGTRFQRALDRTLELARVTDDGQLRGMALTILGRSSLLSTDPRRSAVALEEAIGLTEGTDFIETSGAAGALAVAYSSLGEFDKADLAIRRARELARRSGDPTAAVDAELAASGVEGERGNLEGSLSLARNGAIRADAIGATFCSVVANFLTGVVELRLGRPDQAIAPLRMSLELAQEHHIDIWRNATEASLSSAQCAMGDVAGASAGWARALEASLRNHDTGVEAVIRYQRAMSLAHTPDPDWAAVLADLEESIALFAGLGTRPRESSALLDYARILERLGRADEAVASRRRADTLLAAMGIASGTVPPTPA